MHITTPSTITNVLYEGKLAAKQPVDLTTKGSKLAAIVLEEDELPTVEIGVPQWWNIAELYRAEGMPVPSTISLMLKDADFYLVQLACTFSPGQNPHALISWARFKVDLRPQNIASALPIAFHLHPEAITDEKKRDIHITLSPSLKLKEVEGSLGKVVFDIHYTELLPAITAGGALKHRFSWDLRTTEHYPLRGIRWFHTILKSQHQAAGVLATFDLHAEVQTPRGPGQGILPKVKSSVTDNLFSLIGP